MKTKKELNALKRKAEKEKVETVKRELPKLTDEELAQVTGGYTKVQVDPIFGPYYE